MTATMSDTGGKVGVSLFVVPHKYLAASATPFIVVDGTDRSYVWSTGKTKGRYALSVYDPDGFVRSFAGTIVAADQNSGQVPRVAAVLVPGTAPVLRLTLANDGNTEVVYTLTAKRLRGHGADPCLLTSTARSRSTGLAYQF